MKDIYKDFPITVKKVDSQPVKPEKEVVLKLRLPEVQKTEVTNQKEIIFPEVQKVEITNPTEQKEIVFPETQKVEVVNPQVFPETQKVEVVNPTKNPEVQKVEVINKDKPKDIKFPEVQKVEITNPSKDLDIPVGKGNSPKTADPEKYVPVRLTDGKKFYRALEDAYVAASASSDKLTHLTDGTQNTKVGVANASAPTNTEGSQVYESMDLSGNQRVTQGTLIAGENLTTNRLNNEPIYSYAYIAAGQATTTVKSGAGTLHSITFNSPATATNVTTIYDNTAGSGTVIGIPLATAVVMPITVLYDITFATGLTILTATANGANMTIAYR